MSSQLRQRKGEWDHVDNARLYCPKKGVKQRIIEANGRIHACSEGEIFIEDLLVPLLGPDGFFHAHPQRSFGSFGLLRLYLNDRATSANPDMRKSPPISIWCMRRHRNERHDQGYPLVAGGKLVHECGSTTVLVDVLPVLRTLFTTKSVEWRDQRLAHLCEQLYAQQCGTYRHPALRVQVDRPRATTPPPERTRRDNRTAASTGHRAECSPAELDAILAMPS